MGHKFIKINISKYENMNKADLSSKIVIIPSNYQINHNSVSILARSKKYWVKSLHSANKIKEVDPQVQMKRS